MDAQELKAEGINTVLGNNTTWKDHGLAVICNLPSDWRGTGEDIRSKVAAEPGHPNAWGALVNAAVTKGYIRPTGEYVPMVSKKSRGRRTPVYTRRTTVN